MQRTTVLRCISVADIACNPNNRRAKGTNAWGRGRNASSLVLGLQTLMPCAFAGLKESAIVDIISIVKRGSHMCFILILSQHFQHEDPRDQASSRHLISHLSSKF
jgi:hypothetical protein